LRAVATRGLGQEHTLHAILGAGGILTLWFLVLVWIKSFSAKPLSVFLYLEGGETLDEFLHQFPSVKSEQAIAALVSGAGGTYGKD
jgi:hypothetical protein